MGLLCCVSSVLLCFAVTFGCSAASRTDMSEIVLPDTGWTCWSPLSSPAAGKNKADTSHAQSADKRDRGPRHQSVILQWARVLRLTC